MRYSYNPPQLIKKIFSGYQWDTINDKILFTFDDGPIPETTGKILSLLKEYKIKALFFCVGDNIKKYPQLVEKILTEEHSIGNHTLHHRTLKNLNNKAIEDEIDSVTLLLKKEFNYEVKYFRPPHGRFTISLSKKLKERNLRNVMWSLLTYDYKNDFKLVKFAVENHLNKNSIIVLHDSLKSKNIIEDSIKLIIEKTSELHLEIGEPAGCLR